MALKGGFALQREPRKPVAPAGLQFTMMSFPRSEASLKSEARPQRYSW